MVNMGVRMSLPAVGVFIEVPNHILMDFFLQIDSDSTIAANHLIRTYTGVCGDITAWITNADVI